MQGCGQTKTLETSDSPCERYSSTLATSWFFPLITCPLRCRSPPTCWRRSGRPKRHCRDGKSPLTSLLQTVCLHNTAEQIRPRSTLPCQISESHGLCCKQVPDYPSASNQQQPEAYQQHYSVPQYPGPPPQYDRRASSGGGGLPTVVWVIVGAVIATVVSKVYGVVRSPGGVQGWVRTKDNICCAHISCCIAAVSTCMLTVNVTWRSVHSYIGRVVQHAELHQLLLVCMLRWKPLLQTTQAKSPKSSAVSVLLISALHFHLKLDLSAARYTPVLPGTFCKEV